MSLCTTLDSQLEEFLLSNSLQTTSNGLGLNLSTSNGLDLTCQGYESGLNLSQQGNSVSGQYNYTESVVLNLTQDNNPHMSTSNARGQMGLQQQQQQQYSTFHQSEVGLNLSLQKSYGGGGGGGGGAQTQQQNGYFSHYDPSSGYSYSVPISNNSNQIETQRNSPLNLEHRSSPLNLTSVHQTTGLREQGKICANPYQFQQEYGFGTNYQPQSSQTVDYSYYGQTQQNQSNAAAMYDQGNMFGDGQYFVEATEMMTSSQHQPQTQLSSVNKIRLFCNSCCTEVGSTTELNRHMQRHQMEAMNSIQNGTGHQNQLCSSVVHETQPGRHYSVDMSKPPSCVDAQQTTTQIATGNVLPHWQESFAQSASRSISKPSGHVTSLVTPPETSGPLTSLNSSQPREASVATKKVTKVSVCNLEMSNNSTKKQNEPPEICAECSLAFPTGIDLRKHIDFAHQGRHGKQYQCSQCAQEFDDKESLKVHQDIHAQEKPFRCEKCDLNFSNLPGLKRHVKRVHDKCKQPFICQQCGKSFYEKHDLNRHLRVHLVSKCDKCQKSLGPKHVCKVGKGQSAGNRELKCRICSAQLDTKVAWGYHMWKHTKDPSYITSADTNDISKSDTSDQKKNQSCSTIKPEIKKDSKPTVPSRVCNSPLTSLPTSQAPVASHLSKPRTAQAPDFLSRKLSPERLSFPQAPDAHATSYTQISQPLCLQTSRMEVEEEPVKPLNMQVTINVT